MDIKELKLLNDKVEEALKPFSYLEDKLSYVENIILYDNKYNNLFMCSNGKSIFRNKLEKIDKLYNEQLNILYKRYNIKKGRFFDLPKKEAIYIRTKYHSKPILDFIHECIGLSVKDNIHYNDDELEKNPAIIIVAALTKTYQMFFDSWIKDIKEFNL